jgi:hypothetical protein
MELITILKKEAYEITLDKTNSMFNVNLIDDVEYNDAGFEEFASYFRNTWTYIKEQKDIYYLFLNLGISKKKNELPLHAYIKIIKMITDTNDIMINHCHCVCILTEGSEKWEGVYTLVTKLWNPPEQRPLKFTQSKEEVETFFKSNKLFTAISSWNQLPDGSFVRNR